MDTATLYTGRPACRARRAGDIVRPRRHLVEHEGIFAGPFGSNRMRLVARNILFRQELLKSREHSVSEGKETPVFGMETKPGNPKPF